MNIQNFIKRHRNTIYTAAYVGYQLYPTAKKVFNRIRDNRNITLNIPHKSKLFNPLLLWIHSNVNMSGVRSFRIVDNIKSTSDSSLEMLLSGGDSHTHSVNSDDAECIIPSAGEKVVVRFGGAKLTIYQQTKSTSDDDSPPNFRYYKPDKTTPGDIVICMRADSIEPLKEFLKHVVNFYKKTFYRTIEIKVSSYGSWGDGKRVYKRPFDSLVLPPNIKDFLIQDVKKFFQSEEEYISKGVKFKRGYLLHGPPGTGKTSLAELLASELDMPLYYLSMSASASDTPDLLSLTRYVPKNSILLIEDIDILIHQKAEEKSTYVKEFINVLDGTLAMEGVIVIATTNQPEQLDARLKRAGRFDVQLEFSLASPEEAKRLLELYFPKISPNQIEKFLQGYSPMSGAELVEKLRNVKTIEELF